MEKMVRKGSWSVSGLELVGEPKARHVGLNSSLFIFEIRKETCASAVSDSSSDEREGYSEMNGRATHLVKERANISSHVK